jgi:hypothetical protein
VTYDRWLVEKIREYTRDFYALIKSNSQYLDFVFIAGVSQFSRMGVFSALNNLVDISNDSEFAAFMGLTQEELERRFASRVKATAEWLEMEEAELLNRIRDYYDGFSFDGVTRVYNPFSTSLFLRRENLLNIGLDQAPAALLGNF